MMENLAPAGSQEALDRAVAAGADAVYLGCSAFSARAGAGNFDEPALREAVAFCHFHHVRVHVAVNTLVKDHEFDDLMALLKLLAEVRVDAVLVQDLGVLRMIRLCFPGLTVHASTQMSLHNAAGARWAQRVGIRRVVLARECSLEEIRLTAATGVETEVFGHGAQCVSVSGQCLFSSAVGGRSGNRGRCAQPCRMLYTLRGQKGAWLSPRDVCLRDDLAALADAGACSVKLEGRLKRPEYVAVVAASYRRGLDTLAPATPVERQGLLQIFQRGGFMRGYAMGCEDAAVIDPTRVNHGGVPLGTVLRAYSRFAQIRTDLPLHDGDQLRIVTHAGDYEMLYAGAEVPAGGTARLRLREGADVRASDPVVRLADSVQLRAAMALPLPTVPVDFSLDAHPGLPLSLTASDGAVSVTVTGETVQAAQKRAMTPEDAMAHLAKTGDTGFAPRGCVVRTENAFVPVSALNQLRREALEHLLDLRADAFAPPASPVCPPDACSLPSAELPLTAVVYGAAQLADVPAGARVVWFPEDWRPAALADGLAAFPQKVWLQLPTVCREATLQAIAAFVSAHTDRLEGVVLGSVGQLGLNWPLPFAAGPGIPVMNRRAVQFLLGQGCAFVTASPELNRQELRALMAGRPPVLVPAFGRMQLMLLHHCPARTLLGLKQGHAACALCDRDDPDSLRGLSLTDRTGASFPLQRIRLPEGCQVRLLNCLATDLRAEIAREGWAQLQVFDTVPSAPEKTKAHWNRGVE